MEDHGPSVETTRIDPRLARLFRDIEQRLSQTCFGYRGWYIAVASCLVYHDPQSLSQLYQHLIQQVEHETTTARRSLIRRIREALLKAVCIIGVCKPIEAILAISKTELEESKDYECTREGWAADDANRYRAREWFSKVYRQDGEATMALFSAHKDFAWISENITYGLFLSDRRILDDIETEVVVLSGIMSQNLRQETGWHIRGARRVGLSQCDTQALWDSIKFIAEYFGANLDNVPTVSEIEKEV